MYPLYFFICLLFSVGLLAGLILLAVFPLKLPLAVKAPSQSQPVVRRRLKPERKHHPPAISYWDPPWEDDADDL